MTFKVDPEMIQGTGILGRLGVCAAGIGKRALVFSGEGLVEAASAARVSSLLEDAGVDVISSDAVPILAAADTAEIAGDIARGSRCSMIIAVGGPEVQALARTAAIIGPSHHDTFDFLDGVLPPGPFLPYIAVPVAGSDPFLLSPYYILTDPRDRLVKLVKAPREVCRAVFLDSGVAGAASETYPDAAVFDGFLVALEAWCSRKANILSDMLLEKALACYGNLWHRWRLHPAPSGGQGESDAGTEDGEPSVPPGFDGGEIATEGAFLLALGTAIAPPGPGTALAWAVSGRFPVERTIVSAALLSHTAERLAAVRPEKAARAAELVPGAGNLVERINAALDASGIPFKLRDVGLNLDRLVSAAEAGRALEFVGQSPWTASAEDIFELLKAAY